MDNQTHNDLVEYSVRFIGKCVPGSKEDRSARILWKLVESAFQAGVKEGQYVQQDTDAREKSAETRRRSEQGRTVESRPPVVVQPPLPVDWHPEKEAGERVQGPVESQKPSPASHAPKSRWFAR